MSHKRRTPCCEIEAFRYLTEHDADVGDMVLRAAAETRAAVLAELRAAVEGLYDEREDAPWKCTEFWVDGEPYVLAHAVINAIDGLAKPEAKP